MPQTIEKKSRQKDCPICFSLVAAEYFVAKSRAFFVENLSTTLISQD
jgi:hypothetical protein